MRADLLRILAVAKVRLTAFGRAVRAALPGRHRRPFRCPAVEMGEPAVPLDKALQLSGELENHELLLR